MRRFILQVVVNASAIVLTLLLLAIIQVPFTTASGEVVYAPVMSVERDMAGTYFLIGVIFALLNQFLRPFIVILTGRLLIWSMGLFLTVINAFLFWLAIEVSPFPWQVASPQLVWIFVASLIFSGLNTVFGALLGLDLPDLNEDEKGRGMWRLLDRVSGARRNRIIESWRIQQVYDIMWRYGVEIGLGVTDTPVRRVRAWSQKFLTGQSRPVEQLSTPEKVRLMLQQLGPTWVKIGQMVSSRAEALPEDWRVELTKLQNTVPPFPYEEARDIVVGELGRPPEELFATFEQEPLAAASTAQVHVATLHTGERVVVKVQRPNIVAKVKADLEIMKDVAGVLEKRTQWARQLDVSGVLDEFAEGVMGELDYRNEAYHATRLADVLKPIDKVRVPVIYTALSTSKVLTMEYVEGVKLVNTQALDEAGLDRQILAESFLRAIVKMVLIDGFFHGDPHPGNIFLNPGTGVIYFLDTGLVGDLRPEQRLDLIDLMLSLTQKDSYGLATVLLRLCKRTGPVDEAAFRYDTDKLLNQYWIYPTGSANIGGVLSQVMALLYRHGLRMNNSLTLALKTVMQADETVRILSPSMDLAEVGVQQASALMMQQLTPERVLEEVKTQVVRAAKEVVRRVPSLQNAALSWLDQFQEGRLVVHVDTSELSKEVKVFESTIERLTVGILLVGIIVGSAIALTVLLPLADQFAQRPWIPILGLLVFGGVTLYGLLIARRMWRAARSSDASRR